MKNINISTSHNYKAFTGGQYIKAWKDLGVHNITPTLLYMDLYFHYLPVYNRIPIGKLLFRYTTSAKFE